ncbi:MULTISPECIES: hypothetical protein [unclassified Microcoleus]|uniref:hypothetical protein n=1 Tax=unclassified Microcoleus TaxID=2642155 RepID=UPI002FD33969
MPSTEFELLLLKAGYGKMGTGTAQGNRMKVWWTHSTFRRIEAIYSADGIVAITAMFRVVVKQTQKFLLTLLIREGDRTLGK